jgi:hypothetical protein
MSMILLRLVASFFLFGTFFFLPGMWWIIILLVFSLSIPFYIEGLFFALWYDLLYGPLGLVPVALGHLASQTRTDFFLFLITGLALLLSLFLRDRFSVKRAHEHYLR